MLLYGRNDVGQPRMRTGTGNWRHPRKAKYMSCTFHMGETPYLPASPFADRVAYNNDRNDRLQILEQKIPEPE